MRARQVIVDALALDRQLELDRDQALAQHRVLVDVVLGLPGAVGQLGHARARELLDVVLDLGERRLDGVDAVLVAEALDLALGELRRLGLRLHVADDVMRRARVVGDQHRDVGEVAALVPDAHGRDPQALAHVVDGVDVERAGHGAADIGPVAVGLGEAEQLALVEDAAHDARVVEVRAAHERVVDDEHVARMDVVAEGVDDGLGGEVERADVRGDVARALHHGVALRVAEGRREVARVDHERVAGAEDLLGHLVDDVDERVLENFERDGIERVARLAHRFGRSHLSHLHDVDADVHPFVHRRAGVRRDDRGGIELIDDRGPLECHTGR